MDPNRNYQLHDDHAQDHELKSLSPIAVGSSNTMVSSPSQTPPLTISRRAVPEQSLPSRRNQLNQNNTNPNLPNFPQSAHIGQQQHQYHYPNQSQGQGQNQNQNQIPNQNQIRNENHLYANQPLLSVNTTTATSPVSMSSIVATSTNDIPLNSPYSSGPRIEESAGLLHSSRPNVELRPHRSVRSLFSRKSLEKNDSNNVTTTNDDDGDAQESNGLHQVNSIFTQRGVERHLPIVLEEYDSDDDESLPDIKQVVDKLDDDEFDDHDDDDRNRSGSSTPSTTNGEKKDRRRGHRANIARRKIKNGKSKKARTDSKFISAMRNFYISILSKTLFTRAFIYWLPLATILFIPLAIGAWANPNAVVGHAKLMWLFIWLEVVWGSLWVSRIIAHFLPAVIGVFLGIVSPSWRKYSTILAALELAITYVFWAFVSFITFIPLLSYNHHALKDTTLTQEWQKVVNNILVALLITSLIYLAERLFIHLLSVSFHKTRFATRIRNNKQAISTLSLLLYASYQVFPRFCEEFEEEDMALESGALLQKGKTMKGFAHTVAANQNMQKVVGTVHRVVGSAANALGNVARDIRGGSRSKIGQSSSTYKIVVDALESKYLAEVLANRMWKSLVLEDSEELTIGDLLEVLGNQYEVEAKALFEKLDKDSNGDLTLNEMIQSVQEIGQERKTIYQSLRDMDSAIGKLHSVLLFLVLIIAIIVFIGMLAPSVSAVLATLGSSLLALSFVFSVTAQEILASCVFLFVKHPLDIGDVVVIYLNSVNTQMVTMEISLLYTVLRDTSTGVIRQAPNAVLNTLWIDNMTRSGPMSAAFPLHLGLPETTAEDIDNFKDRLDQFLDDNARDFLPNPYVQITDYPDLDRVTLTISVTYRNNFADGTLFGVRRTKFLKFLASCVNEIPLHVPRRTDTYSNPELPMYSASMNDKEVTSASAVGFRRRQPFGGFSVNENGESAIADESAIEEIHDDEKAAIKNMSDEKNRTKSDFSDAPLSGNRAMQDALAGGFRRAGSTTSRATSSGVNRTLSRGMRRRT